MNVQTSIDTASLAIRHCRTGEVMFTAPVEIGALPRMRRQALLWAASELLDVRGADFSGAELAGTCLQDLDLEGCDLREACFHGAMVDGVSFVEADLRGTDFCGASFHDVGFERARVGGTMFSDHVWPFVPDIHQAVYARASAEGALDMERWHSCETMHCRAGWVVALAGENGLRHERLLGTPLTATFIYLKSDPALERIPDFYTDNDTALADMRQMAEAEAARRKVLTH